MMQHREPTLVAGESPTATITRSEYCALSPIELAIVGSMKTSTDEFSVKAINGATLFKLERFFPSIHKRCILRDNTGNPIVTLRKKRMTAHNRWQVFRGNSDQIDDLLFSVKQPNIFQLKTKLNVFLDYNTEEKVCDFNVEGSWSDGSCEVYAGQCRIAQMSKHRRSGYHKNNFMVRVEASVDYAFIVTLIVILGLDA